MCTHALIHLRAWSRQIIAGVVGLVAAVFMLIGVVVPLAGLLAQFWLFPPLARLVIIGKVLSPLVSFALVAGGTWLVLLLVPSILAHRAAPRQEGEPSSLPEEQPEARSEVSLPASACPKEDEAASMAQEEALRTPALLTSFPSPHPEPPAVRTQGSSRRRTAPQPPEEDHAALLAPLVQVASAQDAPVPEIVQEQGTSLWDVAAEERDARHTRKGTGQEPEQRTPLTLCLLKEVKAFLRAEDGTSKEIPLRGGEKGVRLMVLSYIAWRRGEQAVDRDKLLTHVLSRGKYREMNTEQLGEVFDAAKKNLRQDLRRAMQEMRASGHQMRDDIDWFRTTSSEPGFYWLHPCCSVADLDRIDAFSRSIERMRKEGVLEKEGVLSEAVLDACHALVAAYPGNFLQSLTEKYPDECGSWVREPVTLFRDRYLEALLLLAKHESLLGKGEGDGDRQHRAKAAQRFWEYAQFALNSRWDSKTRFAYRAGKDGERIVQAERALRRCVVELGVLGNPDHIDQCYLTFKERMRILSEGHWQPHADTESVVAEAKVRGTSAYRFRLSLPSNGNAQP